MAQEYKVVRVSQEQPREWAGPHGTVYYIKTMLEGHDKAVSIGKKKPDALKEGDTVYGTIEESDLPEDKFKPASLPKFENKPSGQTDEYWAKKDERIQAQFAIKTAVALLRNPEADVPAETIEHWARVFYAMVDKVSGQEGPEEEPTEGSRF